MAERKCKPTGIVTNVDVERASVTFCTVCPRVDCPNARRGVHSTNYEGWQIASGMETSPQHRGDAQALRAHGQGLADAQASGVAAECNQKFFSGNK